MLFFIKTQSKQYVHNFKHQKLLLIIILSQYWITKCIVLCQCSDVIILDCPIKNKLMSRPLDFPGIFGKTFPFPPFPRKVESFTLSFPKPKESFLTFRKNVKFYTYKRYFFSSNGQKKYRFIL